MSRVLFQRVPHCKCCINSLVNNHFYSRGLFSIIQSVQKSSKRDELGQSLILIEDGTNIRELPIIVRKVSNNSIIFYENNNKFDNVERVSSGVNESTKGETYSSNVDNTTSIDFSNDLESKEIIDYFNKCYTARGIFAILETIPANEVTSHVSLHALKRIVTLENNKAIRNTTLGEVYQLINSDTSAEGLHENETFTRTAVLTQLVDTILLSSDPGVLLSGFLIVNRDIIGKYIGQDIKDRFIHEILCRVTDGKFSINQTCEAIKLFSDIIPKHENVDKLWVGITEKQNDINKDNLMNVVRCIPYLDKSKKVVLSVIEKKVFDYWYTIDSHDVAEILVILNQIRSHSPRILSTLSQWVNKNIHTATEDDLIEIINGFCSLDYNNLGIEQALERYVKAKGVAIKNPTLMANIMDYCSKFHIRSPTLLQGASEYLVVHGSSLSPILLQRLFLPLGRLNYQPSNGFNLWKVVETTLEAKFVQLRPEEAIDMLLHCIYLKKYPLNFVKKVFNPYFLDRLHSYKNKELLMISRSKLQILDMAMSLESPQYQGPILPKSVNSLPIGVDGRIKRMTNNIKSIINEIANGSNNVVYNVVPYRLPPLKIYVIDALILNKRLSLNIWPINFERDYNLHIAIIIHPPDHYCSRAQHLIGEQEMRKRHFRHLGLKVVSLELAVLAKLRVHPKELINYIKERISLAEQPFPKVKSV